MAKQLLNLRNVPDDEADEVRAFLDEHRIEYYETPPNRWGFTMGAIWIRHDEDHAQAKALMKDYQARRAATARADYAARKTAGEVDTFLDVLRREPVKVLLQLALAAGIIALMMWPVWVLMH
ncbi:MAG TPA: DUF6164 family protein [Gammaproteobacteria bacterium]|nr:DUF6164 family protein [Gammaproteobacteria bacterium]